MEEARRGKGIATIHRKRLYGWIGNTSTAQQRRIDFHDISGSEKRPNFCEHPRTPLQRLKVSPRLPTVHPGSGLPGATDILAGPGVDPNHFALAKEERNLDHSTSA